MRGVHWPTELDILELSDRAFMQASPAVQCISGHDPENILLLGEIASKTTNTAVVVARLTQKADR